MKEPFKEKLITVFGTAGAIVWGIILFAVYLFFIGLSIAIPLTFFLWVMKGCH